MCHYARTRLISASVKQRSAYPQQGPNTQTQQASLPHIPLTAAFLHLHRILRNNLSTSDLDTAENVRSETSRCVTVSKTAERMRPSEARRAWNRQLARSDGWNDAAYMA